MLILNVPSAWSVTLKKIVGVLRELGCSCCLSGGNQFADG